METQTLDCRLEELDVANDEPITPGAAHLGYPVRPVSAATDADIRGLAEVLIDCVDGGAFTACSSPGADGSLLETTVAQEGGGMARHPARIHECAMTRVHGQMLERSVEPRLGHHHRAVVRLIERSDQPAEPD